MRHVLVLAAILLVSPPAWAEKCPVPAGAAPALGEVDSAQRHLFIRDGLDAAGDRGRTWMRGWIGFYATAAVVQVAIGGFQEDDDDTTYMYLGAGKSAIAGLSLMVRPLAAPDDARTLASIPAHGERPCQDLARAEALLEHAAADELRRRGWIQRFLAFSLNTAHSLAVGLVTEDWTSAAISFGIGMLTNEVGMYTLSNLSARTLHDYRAGRVGTAPPPKLSLVPWAGGDSAGVLLQLEF